MAWVGRVLYTQLFPAPPPGPVDQVADVGQPVEDVGCSDTPNANPLGDHVGCLYGCAGPACSSPPLVRKITELA